MNRLTKMGATLLLVPLAMAACDLGDDDLAGVGGDNAQMSLYLTDAPGDVAAVWIQIDEVNLVGGGETIELLDEPTDLIEVTTLVGFAQELVDDAEVPEGAYGSLRIFLGGVVLEAEDGEVYVYGDPELPGDLEATGTLMCPSCAQSGLKVQLHGVEVDSEDDALVLDFDVAQSFGHQAGNSGRWIMHPVIHTAFLDDGDDDVDEEGASLTGEVVLGSNVTIAECPAGTARSVEDFVPTATAQTLVDDEEDPVVRTGEVDEDGEFEIDFLEADDYDLGFEPVVDFGDFALTFTATVDPAEVTIEDEDVGNVTYTITGATCAAG